jgi:hypothetical protein
MADSKGVKVACDHPQGQLACPQTHDPSTGPSQINQLLANTALRAPAAADESEALDEARTELDAERAAGSLQEERLVKLATQLVRAD